MKRLLLPAAATVLVLISACDKATVPQPRVVRSMLEQRRDKVIIQAWDISCGAAALATLMTYNEEYPVTEKEVAAGLLKFTSVDKVRSQLGFSLLDLKHYAESRGFEATGLGEVTLRDLLGIGPAILPVVLRGYNHFVVFRGIQGDRVLVADPAWGNRSMLASEFLRIWQSRIAFTIARPHVTPAVHPLRARAKDFWASSATYQQPGMMQAALAPAPERNVMLASVAPGSPLSQVAAGTTGRLPSSVVPVPERHDPVVLAQALAETRQPVAPPLRTAQIQPRAASKPAETPHHAPNPPPDAGGNRVEKQTSTDPSRDVVVSLVQRGAAMVRLGDISGARRLFAAAAESGSGTAATAMGKTFDPGYTGSISALGLRPDLATAETWYRRAASLGDEEGKALLKRIENTSGSGLASGR